MFETLVNALFGCRHKRLTRPITPVHKPGTRSSDTYVACLECGKQFRYDLQTMRMGTAVPLAPALSRSRKSDAPGAMSSMDGSTGDEQPSHQAVDAVGHARVNPLSELEGKLPVSDGAENSVVHN